MKAMNDSRHKIRKTDRRVKHTSFKQRDLTILYSSLASPPSKTPMPRTHHPTASAEDVHRLLVRIHALLEAQGFKSDELFQAVDALKVLLAHVNIAAEKGGSTDCYQAITQPALSLLCRLMSDLVSKNTQIKAIGIISELAYSPYSYLIMESQETLQMICRAMASNKSAICLRAVNCIANLAGDGAARNRLIGIPEVVAGL